jgi:hypothetical protein
VFVIAAAMVPAALLALLLVGYDDYVRERTRLIRDSLSTTRALAVAVDTEFAVAKAALLTLANSKRLTDADFAGFHAEAHDVIRDLRLQDQGSLLLIALVDENGRQFLNTFRRFGEPLPTSGDRTGLSRMFQTGAPAISDLFKGQVFRDHVIGVGVPVKRDGRTLYALNAGISPERFSALLKQQRAPEGWIAVVLDTSGTIVARTHDEARLVGQKGSSELVRRSKQVREDAFDAHTVDGIPVLTVFSRSPVSGWTVAIGIPQRDLVMELVYSLARLFVVGFIALVVAIVLAFIIARRVMRPL